MHQPQSASVSAVNHYLRLAIESGMDVAPLLVDQGLPEDLLSNLSGRVDIKKFEALLKSVLLKSDQPCYGLHTSQYVEPSSYSILGYIAMNCATLEESISLIPIYERIVGDMGVTRIVRVGELTEVRWQCLFSNVLVRRHCIELVLASWVSYTRWLSKREDSALLVKFEHSAPKDKALLAEYEKIFLCPVHFDQDCSAIVINDEMLRQPLTQADPQLLSTLLDHASGVLSQLDDSLSMSMRVKNILSLMLKEQVPSREAIAERLNTTARTLQRKLSEEGSNYQEILDELRRELAENYLSNSQLVVDDIARKIGFADSASFHRRFKQWTGQTPGQWRTEFQKK